MGPDIGEGGPTPEEMGVDPGQLNPPEQPPQPRHPRGFMSRLRGVINRDYRRERDPEIAADVREVNEAQMEELREQEDQDWAERRTNPEDIELSNRPDELVGIMEQMTATQWRERKLQERYGRGVIARMQMFIAGERNHSIDDNGRVRRNACNELVQKALTTVFNKRTAVGISLVAVGVFTGGVSLPVAGTLFGAIGGRGTVEAWHSLCGRENRRGGLREGILRAEFRQMQRLKDVAREASRPELSDDVRSQHIANLVDGFYNLDETVEMRRGELVEEQTLWNKRRRIGELVGGIAGLGVGIWAGFQGLAEKAMTMDIDGDKVAHLVEKVQGDWHYVYNTAEEVVAAQAQGATIVADAGGYATHALGESTATVLANAAKNLAPEAAKVGAVVAGLYLGRLWERRRDEYATENLEQENADRTRNIGEERGFIREQVPGIQEAGGWQQRFEDIGKPPPEAGQIWAIRDQNGIGVIRVRDIDWNTGRASVALLDANLRELRDANNNPIVRNGYEISRLLTDGQQRDQFVGSWLGRFGANDQLRIGGEVPIYDATGQEIQHGDYRVVKDENNQNEVILRRPGAEDVVASPFLLALFDVRRLEPEQGGQRQERQERAPRPEANVRYEVTNRDQLPENLRELPNRFVVSRIDYDRNIIDIYDDADRNNTDSFSLDDWDRIFPNIRRRGSVVTQGGGQQGGGQGGGGGGGGRRR